MQSEIGNQLKNVAKEAMRATREYKLGEAAQEYLETQRKLLYMLHMEKEEISLHPTRKKIPFKGEIVILSAEEWDDLETAYQERLSDLVECQKIIEQLEEIQEKYYKLTNFDNFIKVNSSAYDVDDFEKIRDRFEDEFCEDEPEY